MSCLICKKNNFSKISDELRHGIKNKVVTCNNCGLFQLEKIPTKQEIESCYNTEKVSIPQADIKKLKFKEEFSLRDTIYNADVVTSLCKKGGDILDFGCGYGFFLKEIQKRGFNPMGIETSEIRLNNAKKITQGIDFYREIEELGDKKFDCVTALHVLEHINNPVELLKNLASPLKDEGILVIEVPNLNDHLIEIIPEYKDFYWKIEHLSYFSPDTLEKCFKEAELKVDEIKFVQRWDVYNLMSWFIRKGPQPNEEIIDCWREDKFKWLNGYYKEILSKNGKADTMIAIYQNNKK